MYSFLLKIPRFHFKHWHVSSRDLRSTANYLTRVFSVLLLNENFRLPDKLRDFLNIIRVRFKLGNEPQLYL